MRAPAFWWEKRGWQARVLAPVAGLYGAVAAARLARPGREIGIPVICVGNPTVGGAGKTPVALALARMLRDAGHRPALLSRGYGGSLKGPLAVDPTRHRAAETGDEPLLLAKAAPTVVARDRVAGARAAAAAGADVIVMDDGFQNPSLVKHLALLVVDGRRGLGNGCVFPAGPLRAPLPAQLARADAVVLVGEGEGAAALRLALPETAEVWAARLEPDPAALATLSGKLLAFAGIGDPDKFFATLEAAGLDVRERREFPDHHVYTEAEADALLARAERDGLQLVTTEKDAVRLSEPGAVAALREKVRVLPVRLVFDEPEIVRARVLRVADHIKP